MTPQNSPVFSAFLSRFAAVALGSLVVFGCDAEDAAKGCFPDEGCDGIQTVREHVGLQDGASVTVDLDATEDAPETCQDRDDDGVTYVADGPQACSEIEFACHPGWTSFASTCGCGCEYAVGTGRSDDLRFRGGHAQTACFGGRGKNWEDRAWKCM